MLKLNFWVSRKHRKRRNELVEKEKNWKTEKKEEKQDVVGPVQHPPRGVRHLVHTDQGGV
jgi:hypothetical protein